MAIYKPSLLDKFKDFVNGLKSNWDQYEDHVADFETAKGIITDTFDETRTYAVGDYAIYENVLYKCVEAIEEAGEWDADKWAATNIAEEFNSHLAESSSKHITESGSNANGRYIKFDDGTMICQRAVNPDRSIVNEEQSFSYPMEFISTPYVTASHQWGSNAAYQKSCATMFLSGSEAKWRLAFTESTSIGMTQYTYLMAIGRWK
jgi:hypothetical protein